MNPNSASLPAIPGRTMNQKPASAKPVLSEDEELEQIMRDVGSQLKKEDFERPKRRLFNFGHEPKRDVPFSAQVVHHPQQLHKQQPAPGQPKPIAHPAVAAAPKPRLQPAPQPADAAEAQLAKIQPHPKASPSVKPKKQASYPVFVLFVAFLVTGFLIVAAIAAYRQ
jgi:hypothetical protein